MAGYLSGGSDNQSNPTAATSSAAGATTSVTTKLPPAAAVAPLPSWLTGVQASTGQAFTAEGTASPKTVIGFLRHVGLETGLGAAGVQAFSATTSNAAPVASVPSGALSVGSIPAAAATAAAGLSTLLANLGATSMAEGSLLLMRRTLGGTQVTYSPSQTVQTGKVITGTLNVGATQGFTASIGKPKGLVRGAGRIFLASLWRGEPIQSVPAHGTATVDANGVFTYTPSQAFAHSGGVDSFSVTIKPVGRPPVVVPVIVNVNPFNAAPEGTAKVNTPDENGTVRGTVAVTDKDGDRSFFAVPASTDKGSVTINPSTGAFTYTPNADARHAASADGANEDDLSDTVTITVRDGWRGKTTIPVTVAISPSNVAPVQGDVLVGTPDSVTGVVDGKVSVTDADKDTVKFTGPASTKKGSVTLDSASGAFTYTPSDDARHIAARDGASADDLKDTFSVTADDGHGGTVEVPVAVIVRPTKNIPIEASTPSAADLKSGEFTGQIKVPTEDGNAPTFQLTEQPTKGTVSFDEKTGKFTYTPTAEARHAASADGADPSDSFTVEVKTPDGGWATQTISFNISPQNDAPEATADIGEPDKALGTVVGSIVATDLNKDTLRYELVDQPTSGTVEVDPITGAFSYTPSPEARHQAAAETDNLVIGESLLAREVAMTLDDGAPAGVMTLADVAPEDGLVLADPIALEDGMTGPIEPPTATPGGRTTDTFSVLVNDGHGGLKKVNVTVQIDPTNTNPDGTAKVDFVDPVSGQNVGSVTASDADSDALTFTADHRSDKGTGYVSIDSSTGAFVYTPTTEARLAGGNGGILSDTFTVVISDNHGGRASAPVDVSITPLKFIEVAPPSIAPPDPATGAFTGVVNVPGKLVSLKLTGAPTRGTLELDQKTGKFTYTPSAAARHEAAASGGHLVDRFVVDFTTEDNGWATQEISFEITPQNTAPEATANISAPQEPLGSVEGSVKATDADSDTLSYELAGGPAFGSVRVDSTTGGFTYTPTPEARHNAATEVVEVVDAPIVPIKSVGVIGELGTTTNTAVSSAPTSDTFVVVVNDGHGGQAHVRVNVPIDPTNTNPQGTAKVDSIDPTSGVNIGSVIATDADDDTLTFTTDGYSHGGGTVRVDPSTGAFVYTPTTEARNAAAVGGETADAFTIFISDNHGGRAGAPVNVTITPAETDPCADGSCDPGPVAPNTAPTAILAITNVSPDGVVTGAIRGTDAEGDTLYYRLAEPPRFGYAEVDLLGGGLTYTPEPRSWQSGGTLTESTLALPAGVVTPLTIGTDDGVAVRIASSYPGGFMVRPLTPTTTGLVSLARGPQMELSFTFSQAIQSFSAPVVLGVPTDGTLVLTAYANGVPIGSSAFSGTATPIFSPSGAQIGMKSPSGTISFAGPLFNSITLRAVSPDTGVIVGSPVIDYVPGQQIQPQAPTEDYFTVVVEDGNGGMVPVHVTVPVIQSVVVEDDGLVVEDGGLVVADDGLVVADSGLVNVPVTVPVIQANVGVEA